LLIAFLKSENEADADCKIVKYADRVFASPRLISRSSNIQILRVFCIEVLPTSKCGITQVQMLCPSQVTEVQDESERLLQVGHLTSAATAYNILSKAQRQIEWDGLDSPVKVADELGLKSSRMGDGTLVQIQFNERLNPGERLAIGLSFNSPRRVAWLSLFRRELRLSYFLGPQTLPKPFNVIPRDLEIPCLTWYKGDPAGPRVAGGFDVLVSCPRNYKVASSPPGSLPQSTTYYSALGDLLRTPMQLCTWRLRSLTSDQTVSWRLHDFDMRLDIEIPSTWPMFVLSVLVSVIVATIVGPWLREKFWTQQAQSPAGAPAAAVVPSKSNLVPPPK
jgi:hypothetical protein